MDESILVLNAGSSTLKFALFPKESGEATLRESIPMADAALESVFSRIDGRRVAAVGHRVVHGGRKHASATRLSDDTIAELEALVPLAPLHQPHSLAEIRAVRAMLPNVLQIACFDTAFHRTMPEVAQRFGLPRRFTEEGVLRYGFHGLSYQYIASKLPPTGRSIVAHLGNGASLCAMKDRRSVATTMSFTPADGLLMGTRCGALDPGVLLYLMNHRGLSAADAERLVNRESGLLGVSGLTSDMRTLLESSDPRAAEAVDLFVYRIGREIGSLAAALGGVGTLVFTRGIGERSPTIRDRVTADAAWLGSFETLTIPTDEERVIADATREILAG